MTRTQSIWAKTVKFPPVLVRILAKNPDGNAMTDEDVRRGAPSGSPLTPADIKWLSYLPTWDAVPVRLLRAFTVACGVDFADRAQMRNANRYLNTDPKFTHLRRSPHFPAFREMLKVYYDSQTQ